MFCIGGVDTRLPCWVEIFKEGSWLLKEITLNLVTMFRYCLITSMDGGRSFYAYQVIMTNTKISPSPHPLKTL
jgi:hypothetical protein